MAGRRPASGTGVTGAAARRPTVTRFIATSAALGVVVAAMALPFLGSGALAARNAARSFESLPSILDAPPPPARSVLLAADGSTLGEIAYENRVQVPFNEISPIMRAAIVAIEDSRFYAHGGVDVRGSLRALARNSSSGEVEEGGSTLTQQYVKNVLIEDAKTAEDREAARERTLTRKLQEARYAIALENRLTKDEILERYLNIAFFGDGAYGVEAAATHYFGVHADQLTLVQAATLAGIVQSPARYNPVANPKDSQARRDIVLTRMQAEGLAEPAAVAEAKATPITSYLDLQYFTAGCISSTAPYFCDYVLSVMKTDPAFGATVEDREALLKRGGLTIQTTLDPAMQSAAQRVVDGTIPRKDKSGKAAAVVTVQPGSGHIRVMTQNRTYGSKGRGRTTINYSVDLKHNGTRGVQAGSTFKAFTLAAALDKGLPVDTYLSTYSGQRFTGFKDCQGNEVQSIAPSSDANGSQSMESATAYSVNGYFVALEREAGLCTTAKMIDKLGVRQATGEKVPRVASLTLGSATTTPLDMANAYATFAAEGMYCNPVAIVGVLDRDGRSLPVPSPGCTQAISPAVAQTVTQLLETVINGRYSGSTGRGLGIGRPAAGKTGTTDNSAALWFVGYTPQLSTAVWVGDPLGGNRYPMRNVTVNGRFYAETFGATLAGPIWRDVMKAALKGTAKTKFTEPDPGGGVNGIPTVVPDLTNADSADAIQRLADVGLVGSISPFLVPSALPAGTVVYTSPGAGSRLRSGDNVVLRVSSGVPPPPPPPPVVPTTTPSVDSTTPIEEFTPAPAP